jgi:hypothetical protein
VVLSRIAMNTTVLRLACFALLLHALAPNPVSAAENMQFRVYVGSFNTNAWVAGVEEKDTLELGFELHGAPIAETQFAPLIGTTANVDNAAWFYLGLRWNQRLDGGWQMAPSFAVTLYDEGDSKELGHELAFRSVLFYSVPLSM